MLGLLNSSKQEYLTGSFMFITQHLAHLIENWQPMRFCSHCSASFWLTLITAWCDTTVADLLLIGIVTSSSSSRWCWLWESRGRSDNSRAVCSESTLDPVDIGIYKQKNMLRASGCFWSSFCTLLSGFGLQLNEKFIIIISVFSTMNSLHCSHEYWWHRWQYYDTISRNTSIWK